MTGHVFLSYSHASDGEYVELLAKHMTEQGVTVWFDRDIISGDRWASVIRAQIDSCAAFIVVMSPAAEESVWVNREINRAEHMSKPVYPLLLKGAAFFRISDLQYEDVTGGRMPPSRFVDRLRGHPQGTRTSPQPSTPDAATLKRQHDDAATMSDRGDHLGAVQVLRHVLADRIRVLGADNVDTMSTRYALAHSTGESGDRAEAIELFRELAADLTRNLGADDEVTLWSRYMLAHNISESGNYGEAVKLLRDLLADRTRVLGADHLQTLLTRYLLAHNIGESGNRAEATRLLRDLLPELTRVLGPDAPHTLSTRYLLAHSIGESGNRAEGARLLRELLPVQTRVLGADHPHVKITADAIRAYS